MFIHVPEPVVRHHIWTSTRSCLISLNQWCGNTLTFMSLICVHSWIQNSLTFNLICDRHFHTWTYINRQCPCPYCIRQVVLRPNVLFYQMTYIDTILRTIALFTEVFESSAKIEKPFDDALRDNSSDAFKQMESEFCRAVS